MIRRGGQVVLEGPLRKKKRPFVVLPTPRLARKQLFRRRPAGGGDGCDGCDGEDAREAAAAAEAAAEAPAASVSLQ